MNRKNLLIILCLFAFMMSVNAQYTSIYQNDFSSGTTTGLDINAGIWDASSLQLAGSGSSIAAISRHVDLNVNTTYKFEFKMQRDANAAGLGSFHWFTDINGISDITGYGLLVNSTNTRLIVYNNIGGVLGTLITQPALVTGIMHDVNIVHTFDGNISLWIDTNYLGSVIDRNYSEGNKIVFAIEGTLDSFRWDDVNVSRLTSSSNTFRVVDEETSSGLAATMTVNGLPWFVASDGTFDVNSQVTFPATYVVSKLGYDTRTFVFDTNAGLHEVRRFGLRNEDEAKSVDFQFYADDEVTQLPNRFVQITRNGILAGHYETDADAIVNFAMASQEPLYDINIFLPGFDAGAANVQYSYFPILVTVNRPIDEKTNLNIDKIWSVNLSGLGSDYQDANNSSKNFFIFGNTVKTYDFFVDDSNTTLDEYFPSNYSKNYKGDTSTAIIQPYLLLRTDGSEIVFTVYNKFTNTTIPDLLVTAERQISGTQKEVRSNITNGTGIVVFSFLNSLNYDITVGDTNGITVYFPNEGENGKFNDAFPSYAIFISITSVDANNFVADWNIISKPPSDSLEASTTQYFDVNVNTNYADSVLVEYFDGNIPIAQSLTQGQDKNFAIVVNTVNTGNFITLKVTITTDYRIDVYIQSYHIIENPSTLGSSFTAFSNNTGTFGGLIILLAAIFITVQAFGPGLFGNNESQLFIVGLIMIGGGILFFSTNFFPIIVALAFGIAVYLQVRA